MTELLRIEREVDFGRTGRRGRQEQCAPEAEAAKRIEPGRIPRVSKLMALAIRFEELVRDGVITNYAELARLGQVTRARITQILNLTLLAPDVQEAILFLPRVKNGRDPIHLRQLQNIALVFDWSKQRKLWKELQHNPSAC
ncbi:MAG: hypothetical protein ACFCD0_13000 [Gemmataceae bacterium]